MGKKPKIDTPFFDAYLDEIGAERLGYTRAMVKTYGQDEHGKSYYSERAVITIDKDGCVVIRGKGAKEIEPPTAAQAEAIQKEMKAIVFPKSITQTEDNAEALRISLKVAPSHWFVLRASDRRKVIMCHQRVDQPDMTKIYLPWSYFDYGDWEMKEPGGDDFKLPFWKPIKKTNMPQIMVHEGAKAAKYVDWLCNENSGAADDARASHPFYQFLRWFEHWGIIGGASAPHRADYDELHNATPSRVVYCCDRDFLGETALQQFSRHYRGKMDALRLNEKDFPLNWDMADAIPKKMILDGVYVGEPIENFLQPATWATDPIDKSVPSARQSYKLRDEFIKEWKHAIRPEVFIHTRFPGGVLSLSEFNNLVDPFSDIRNPGAALKRHEASKVRTLTYIPAANPGTATTDDGLAYNVHQPTHIKPAKARRGDERPWIEYLENTFPIEYDRYETMKWVYTLLAHPEIKMSYGILLCSETQGVGKTTLGQNVLAPLLGYKNVSYPNEREICDSSFSDWKSNVRLVCVNEIYAGHNVKAYNVLKDLITDKIIRVNKKFQAPYQQENWAHVMACSNSMRALKLPDDDRRWLVPKVTEEILDKAYWNKFNRWLQTGGLSIILWHATEFFKSKSNEPINIGERAPFTRAKQLMIEENDSPGMGIVRDWFHEAKQAGEVFVVTCSAMRELISQRLYDGRESEFLERASTIVRLAKQCGLFVSLDRKSVRRGWPLVRIISNEPRFVDMSPGELEKVEKVEIIKQYKDFNL